MGYVRDRWTAPGPSGRRVHTERWGHGMRWQAIHTGQDGQRRSKNFDTKDAAGQWLAECQTGVWKPRRPGSGMTVGEWAGRWRGGQLHWRESTAQSARIAVEGRIVPVLGDRRLDELTRHDVQDAVTGWAGEYSPATVRVTYSYLTGMLRTALADGLLTADPTVGVKLPPKPKGRLHLLTLEQVEAIRNTMSPRFRQAVVFGAATGLRPGEWRGLTWDRVDLAGGTVTVDRQAAPDGSWGPPKSAAGVRTISLGEVAADALRRQDAQFGHGDDGRVWISRTGGAVSRSTLSTVWTQATEGMTGLPARSGWHDLRHFNASMLIAAGRSVRAVADRLGHADISETLETYLHLWPGDDERSAEIVDGVLRDFGAPPERPE